MTFLGFLVFFDPAKPGIIETINSLKQLGVSLKIITGDNQLVAAHISQQVGLANAHILTGPDLNKMSNPALLKQVNDVSVFAEVEPNQKERILIAMKKAGNVVGYMGDGINDASAIHAADVGISVNSAVDVAKEAADIVLLEKDLSVLVQGVREGRTTFANTLKYVFMATSANFYPQFYVHVRRPQFGFRLPDVWCAPVNLARERRSISHGLVPGVGDFGVADCTGYPE